MQHAPEYARPGGATDSRWPRVMTAMTIPESELLERESTGKRLLEVGAEWGYSTVVSARVAEHVWSLDWHRGLPPYTEVEHNPIGRSLMQFYINLEMHDVLPKVSVLVGRTDAIMPVLGTASFEMVFVDADHSREGCLHDLLEAYRLVRPGGAILAHDYQCDMTAEGFGWGVTEAVDDFCFTQDWAVAEAVGYLAVLRARARRR